jgi:hypothetical protein
MMWTQVHRFARENIPLSAEESGGTGVVSDPREPLGSLLDLKT